MMERILLMERRIIDLEHKLANFQRPGRVTEVKFDEERKRWYAKVSDKSSDDDPNAFNTNWLPWSSFGHGTISASVPPRVGQLVNVHSPNGQPELAYVASYHHTPQDKSPHDKQDEIFLRVNVPREGDQDESDPQQTLTLHATKDKLEIKLGDTVLTHAAGSWTLTTKEATVNADKVTANADQVTVNAPSIDLGGEGGKPVARIGDLVSVSIGSSAGLWPIVEGSGAVRAVD